MLKVIGITKISKIKVFNFCSLGRVKQNQKKKKKKVVKHSKPPKFAIQSLFKQFQQKLNIFFGFSLNI